MRPTSTGRTAAPVQPPLALTVRVKACACAALSRTAALNSASPASRAITLRSTATACRYDGETLRSGCYGDPMGARCLTIQSYGMSGVVRASVQDGWCRPSGCARFPGASGTRFTTRVALWKHQTLPNRKHTALPSALHVALSYFRPERGLVNVCRQVVDESSPLVITAWLPFDQVQVLPPNAARWQSYSYCCG